MVNKAFPAHIQGVAIGLVTGAAVVINFGGMSLFALAAVSFVLATVSYGLEKRGDRR